MIIKLEKGEIKLKTALNRREKYDLEVREDDVLIFDPIKRSAVYDQEKVTKLKEHKVLLAIQSITVNNEEKPITLDTLLNEGLLTDSEFREVFDKGLKHCNELSAYAEPSKKS